MKTAKPQKPGRFTILETQAIAHSARVKANELRRRLDAATAVLDAAEAAHGDNVRFWARVPYDCQDRQFARAVAHFHFSPVPDWDAEAVA